MLTNRPRDGTRRSRRSGNHSEFQWSRFQRMTNDETRKKPESRMPNPRAPAARQNSDSGLRYSFGFRSRIAGSFGFFQGLSPVLVTRRGRHVLYGYVA